MSSRKQANLLNERFSLVCLVFLWITPVVFATNYGADLVKDDNERLFLRDVESHILETERWLHDQAGQDGTDGELLKRSTRDPHDLLMQFGFTHMMSDRMANAVRVLKNVSSTYSERTLSELSGPAKRELCSAAGVDYTVSDCPSTSIYRTHNGACNNPLNVNWGKAFTPFVRQLPAAYADALDNPRHAESGEALPPPRLVCLGTIKDAEKDHDNSADHWTLLSMHFGQFLDHDVDHSALENVSCTCEITPKCLPIMIPSNDSFFTAHCFKFQRSVAVPDEDCNTSPRQQLNQITSFLDLSQVYGNSETQGKSLRDLSKGKGLMLSIDDPHSDVGHELLPNDEEHKDCIIASPQLKCGRTGDARAAEQPGLASLHTVLLRQHNRIAEKLSILNPGWNDEKLYQEARAVCIAMWQHIVYNEYLPPLLGSKNMAKHGLQVHPTSYLFGYDPHVNPSISNVFATAAFRMGHSQIPTTLLKLDRDYAEIEHVKLDETFFNATHLVTSPGQSGMDAFLRGMIVQKLLTIDLSLTAPITKHLFADPEDGQGLDLAALNIQRGRDHGIADYNAWRKYCKLPEAGSFDDLLDVMSEASVSVFRKTYASVNDIDLFPALIGETPERGQLVGATLACLIGEQFHRLKFGDRFWYENGLGEQAFKRAQLLEIRKATMARVLCDTTNDVPTIQPYVFRVADTGTPPDNAITSFYTYSRENHFPDDAGDMPGFFNGRVSCQGDDNIPELNLEPWTEGYVDVTEDDGLDVPFGG
ncbi:salivary peroxidase/catechol oxidase-like [Asterias amurensis]|uniref:salivary peroxidase/catechol oxidase-like n=1 Tax=Asterias amurensis TaxID=7602 RepID=UPI003AB16BAD